VRIHCLTTGRVRRKRGERGVRRYFVNDWADETLPVNAFLVEHEDGLCLFDTGQTARAAGPGYFPSWYPFFRLSRFELTQDDEVAAQIARLGHQSRDVRWVVLSHLHTDHVGGIDSFPGAEVLVSRTEWEAAQGVGGRVRGYLPQYWPAGVGVTPVDLVGPALGPFATSYDIVGDGSLVLVPTTGHTRGHMSLLVRAEEGSFLLGGDAVMSSDELGEKLPDVAGFCASEGVMFLAAHDPNAGRLLTGGASRQP
jgi:glyoxylase-like metal-dependent hydrolase (beta-lactamase superfamily II)